MNMFLRKLCCVWLASWALVAVGPAAVWAAEEAEEAAHSEHAAGEEGGENPNPLVFDPDLAIFSAIVFLLLLGILGKFAWPQIAKALDEREQKISDNITAAAGKHEEAKRMLAGYEAKLASAAGEVRELLEEARRDAEATKTRIAAEARQASEEEKNRALREIERAKNGAIQELANASANVAIDLARKIVREDLTADRQSQIVREALSMMKATDASRN
jgi:F-type H+-transporting ATPase subunit b